jgi:hypothetical protein
MLRKLLGLSLVHRAGAVARTSAAGAVRPHLRRKLVLEADPANGGALEFGAADQAEPVVAVDAAVAVDRCRDLATDLRDALRAVAAGDVVLATATRHDLIAEGTGGAELGTAVTPVAPIDVVTSVEAGAFDDGDTFTLAAADEAAAPGAGADEPPARSGGAWAETLVNERGAAPGDQHPNAKIKL